MTITVEHLGYIYQRGTPHEHRALSDISFEIPSGTCTAIVGVTGSGKSTLVQHFNGLMRPSEGAVVVDDVRLEEAVSDRAALRQLRQRVGLLFQFPETQLFAPTVYDDIAFGPRQQGLAESDVRDRVEYGLRAVALQGDATMLARSPFGLSGGQRRRVAIAGVLAMRPSVLVLDEPGAGLDLDARDGLFSTLQALQHDDGLTIVLVSHDMSEVLALAQQIIVLARSELRLAVQPAELLRYVDTLRAAGLLPPPLGEAVHRLRANGWQIEPDSLSPESVAKAIQQVCLSRRRTHVE